MKIYIEQMQVKPGTGRGYVWGSGQSSTMAENNSA